MRRTVHIYMGYSIHRIAPNASGICWESPQVGADSLKSDTLDGIKELIRTMLENPFGIRYNPALTEGSGSATRHAICRTTPNPLASCACKSRERMHEVVNPHCETSRRKEKG